MSDQQDNQNHDLEFNDGLGDLLREKDIQEFSWSKTVLVLGAVIIIIFVIIIAGFKIGRTLIEPTPSSTTEDLSYVPNDGFLDQVFEVEEESNAIQNQSSYNATVKLPKSTVKTAPSTTAGNTADRPYKVIVGTYRNKAFAADFVKKLKTAGFDGFIWSETKEGTTYYKVQAGAFSERNTARKLQKPLKDKGFDSYILKK